MQKINFGIQAEFLGKEFIMAPTNGENRQRLQEIDDNEDMKALARHADWYETERNKILDDGRLKDETKAEKINALSEEFNEKTEGFEQTLPEYRKAKLDVIVDEWIGEEPSDDFYSNEKFDDYALNRLVTFFLTPKEATLSGK